MKKKNVLFSALAFAVAFSYVKVPVYASETDTASAINWATLYGNSGSGTSAAIGNIDTLSKAEMLSDGSILAAGTFDGNKVSGIEGQKGKADAALVLYDANGNLQWQTLVGGSNVDRFSSVIVSDYGGYVAVGGSQSNDGDLENKNHGGYDGIVAKFSETGSLEKIITVGGDDKDYLNDIFCTYDGGYIAVGYSHSSNGDFENLNISGRDAVIVKLNADLEIEWVNKAGFDNGNDEFVSALNTYEGGYMAVGYANDSNDALVAKFSAEGTLEWQKTYGGSGSDVFSGIKTAHLKEVPRDKEDITIDDLENGYILTGTSNSNDGDFAGVNTTDTNHAFILRMDKDGNIDYAKTLENSVDTTGDNIIVIADGYLVTGTYQNNDLDFTGSSIYGKKDIYVAHFAKDGTRLNVFTFGGAEDDIVEGILQGYNDNYLAYGYTKSSPFYEQTIQGRIDGFMLSIDGNALETYTTNKALVPVQAYKANDDSLSMMAPLLYKDAYVESVGERYQVTVYFTNATIMGTQINASTLLDTSYEYKGEMIATQSDTYDEITQVKSVTMLLDDLSQPVPFHIEGAMGDIRLVFDPASMIETETPPYFAPVVVTVPDFETAWKTNIGGSDVDYSEDFTVLNNGHLLVAGQSYSNDMDFQDKLKGFSSATISEYDNEGNLLYTHTLGGTEFDSIAYAGSIDAYQDGGYVVGGGYQEGVYVEPTGDFASLNTADSVHGLLDGWVAKYDNQHQLIWISGFSGSQNDQVKQVKATNDGGCLALVETNSNDGDIPTLEGQRLFDLFVVKYDQNGQIEWKTKIGGINIESASFGLDILNDGSYIVGGHFSSWNEEFDTTPTYNTTGIFDIFAANIDKDGNIVWIQSYGGDSNEYVNSVLATKDGGFIMVGDTKSTTNTFAQTGTYYDNAFVLKCDSTGQIEWIDVIKSTENSEATRVVELEDQYIVLGNTRGTDFDFAELSKGSMDVFVAKYDKAGNRTSLETIGGTFADYSAQIMAINDYQVGILFYGESTDGDLANLNRGETDATLLAFNYRDKPVEPTPDPVEPTPDPTPDPVDPTPDIPVTPNPDTNTTVEPTVTIQPSKTNQQVNTQDNTNILPIIAAGLLSLAGLVYLKKNKKYS